MKILFHVDYEQAFYSSLSDSATENVVVTSATGRLCAKKVFHLSVRKYSPKQKCIKVC